ncbi:MAG: hydrogenase-1 expression HyaE [Gammaproteobacteria bacterium]|nr:MAG: hydrogenase-1 expression HyaE [Gammaproteobacteria bacterium]
MPSTLIKAMIEQYNYPVLNETLIDEYIQSKEECVLFFTENPTRFPESDDVAMILPELVTEYGNRFSAAVISQDSQRKLQARYDFKEWPTLVFLRKGEYLGAISRVQDWNDYIMQINDFLTAGPKKILGIGVPIETSSATGCS